MLTEFSDTEKKLLTLAIPALGLPALKNPTRTDLFVRAFELDYPDDVTPRGEKILENYLRILGAIPSTYEENLKLITEGVKQ
jgi:hypothetical protein